MRFTEFPYSPGRERRRPETPRSVEPLTPLAEAPVLALLLDVDSLCTQLNGRIDQQLIHTLGLLARAEVQVVLVSARAHVLAQTLHAHLEGTWWYDRTIGWHDGDTPKEASEMSFALVVAQLRRRMPQARLVAVSNDPSLRAALDGEDRAIGIEPVEDPDRSDVVTSKQLSDALWCLIEIRMYRRNHHRR